MIFNELSLDFTNILVAIASAVIIYFAWKSTNVQEDRIAPATVLIIENNRRRLLERIVREPSNSITHNLSSHLTEDDSNIAEEIDLDQQNERIETLENLHLPEAPPSLQAIIDEVVDLAASSTRISTGRNSLESVEEDINRLLQDSATNSEPQRIIEIMDNPNNYQLTERRRITVYEESSMITQNSTEGTSRSTPIRRENLNVPSSDTTIDNSHAENCSNENNENENISTKTECKSSTSPQAAEGDASATIGATTTDSVTTTVKNTNTHDSDAKKQEFRIKLKYLNDELRLVKGSPNEAIGDFKKRNFTVELSAQKLVRLVFNGHVLQPDSKTLKACGLFDNCVVHCLIHNKKPSPAEETSRNNNNQNSEGQSNRSGDRGGLNTFTDESRTGVSLVYIGIILSGLSIVFGWYCRFTYGFVFSWYSTIGLGIMSVIFLVLTPVLFLIERGVSI